MDRRKHWDGVYQARDQHEFSWFQPSPSVSLALISDCDPSADARVLDAGGGTSLLVDNLLDRGFERVAVMDVSERALAVARARLGPLAGAVTWYPDDVLAFESPHLFDIWHDRALFHFLVDPEDRARYRTVVESSVRSGGNVILGGFGPDGPRKCSGLPCVRHSARGLASELGPGFRLLDTIAERHHTPSGAVQSFVYARFLRE